MSKKNNKFIVAVTSIALSAVMTVSSFAFTLETPIVSNFYDSYLSFSEIEVEVLEDFLFDYGFRNNLREYMTDSIGLDILINQDIALNNLNSLLSSFPTTRFGTPVYPDYYGGTFLDDHGHLVILVTDADTSFARARNMPNVRVNEVTYSFNEMMYVTNKILYFVRNNPYDPLVQNITSWGPDVVRNRVTVDLLEYSEHTIQLFESNILNSSLIEFNMSSGIITPDEYIPLVTYEMENFYEDFAPFSATPTFSLAFYLLLLFLLLFVSASFRFSSKFSI